MAVDARTGIATVDVGPLRGDLRLVATDGRSASDTRDRARHRSAVRRRGVDARDVSGVSRRGRPRGSPVGEPARVPQGTIDRVAGPRVDGAARRAARRPERDTVALRVNDHAFSGRFEPKRTGSTRGSPMEPNGPIADVPPPLELEVVPDSAPHVELVSPAIDTIVAGDDKITLRATASDDHGIARVELVRWKRVHRRRASRDDAACRRRRIRSVWDGTVVLDLGAARPQAGRRAARRRSSRRTTRRGRSAAKAANCY